MANVIHTAHVRMCTIIPRAVPSLKYGVRALSTITSDSNSAKSIKFPIWPNLNTANNNETERKSIHPKPESHLFKFSNSMELDTLGNLKLDAIALTALHYSANLKPKTSLQSLTAKTSIKYNVKSLTETLIELPNESKNIAIKDPIIGNNKTFYINPLPDIKIIGDPILPDAAKIEECPKGPLNIEKQAKRQSRMIKIRKKKMKVHRRKRLWKRMWSVWKKKFFSREKKREIAFRHKLIDKVRTAEKFDPEAYIDNYLEDSKFEFTPKTYFRKAKPKFLIEQLLERDRQVEKRKHANNTHMLTNEPLIRKGETVEEFVERNWK